MFNGITNENEDNGNRATVKKSLPAGILHSLVTGTLYSTSTLYSVCFGKSLFGLPNLDKGKIVKISMINGLAAFVGTYAENKIKASLKEFSVYKEYIDLGSELLGGAVIYSSRQVLKTGKMGISIINHAALGIYDKLAYHFFGEKDICNFIAIEGSEGMVAEKLISNNQNVANGAAAGFISGPLIYVNVAISDKMKQSLDQAVDVCFDAAQTAKQTIDACGSAIIEQVIGTIGNYTSSMIHTIYDDEF